ncbi:antitoxin Xre/MbcA/ParS toxin-binding domain-containing protein [Variovorax sp. KK3]|uniref:MbcA/ParS/Xre antitoxin family protein n=1 Tax=Variovorax sp. KK3 TaxID=1855728 RepID=UPI00097CB970|nr:antitoxin Xre/MbcA/ParS toxin-binding domain-containing protein [Variovorax sp. KK3]
MARPQPVARQPASVSAVLTKATLRAAEFLGLNNAALARIVGLSESQISRIARGEKSLDVGTKSAELATLLVRVYRSLDALVGNDDGHRKAWMTSFNRAFNETPKDAVQKVDGLVRVVNYLDGARALV